MGNPLGDLFSPVYKGYITYAEKGIDNHLEYLNNKMFPQGPFEHLMSTLRSYHGVISLELGRTIDHALHTNLTGQQETIKELIAALEETILIHQNHGEYQDKTTQDHVVERIHTAKKQFHNLLEAQKKLMKL